jgi:hypothetical protein
MSELLREYVRLTLSEGAQDIGDLALTKKSTSRNVGFILWDPEALRNLIMRVTEGFLSPDDKMNSRLMAKVDQEAYKRIKDWAVGMIQLVSHRNELWDAWEVQMSAARKGYGPLMYDIAMSACGRITSDRRSISKSAESVWAYYHDRRSDVKKLPFDDRKNPRTPPKIDDAELYGNEVGQSPLDYTYEGASIDTSSALHRGDEVIESIAKEFKISKRSLDDLILRSGHNLFGEMYGENLNF